MSGEYLPDWSQAANYRFVVGTKGLFGKWSFSLDTPSSVSFAAINVVEEGNGWATAVVSKNDAIRRGKRLVWVNDKGICVGPRPIGDLVGPHAFSWLASIPVAGNEAKMAAWGMPTVMQSVPGHYPSQQVSVYTGMMTTGTCVNQRLAAELYTANTPNPSVWRAYFETLIGVPLQPGTAVRTAITGYQNFDITSIESQVEQGYLVCAVIMEGLSNPADANSGKHNTVVFKCPSPAGMEGIRYLAYAGSYTASWMAHAVDDAEGISTQKMTIRLHGVGAESMWKHLLSVVAGKTTVDTVAGVGYSAASDLTTLRFRLYAPYNDTPFFTDYARFRVGGFPGTGLSAHEATVFGQPEFIENFYILGAVVINGKELKVTEDCVVLDWVGDRLVQLSAADELTQDQKDRLVGLRVRSAVFSRQRTITGPLVSKLSFARDASKADVDLPNEVMFAADGEQPALTFAQAEKAAVGKEFRSLHQIISKDSVGDYTHLDLTGDKTQPLTLSWALYKGVAKVDAADVDDALWFIREGGRIRNLIPTTTLDEALNEVFGVPLATFSSSEIDPQAVADFDEVRMFKDKAPNVDNLSPSQYAGFALLHFGRSRNQMDSFVAASMAYGRYSHKKLVGGEIIKIDPN